jgi:hypothetical protein
MAAAGSDTSTTRTHRRDDVIARMEPGIDAPNDDIVDDSAGWCGNHARHRTANTYHHDPREDPAQLAHSAAVVAGGTRLR